MMINMKLIQGPRYIEALLQRVILVKELFLMDMSKDSKSIYLKKSVKTTGPSATGTMIAC